MTASPKRIEMMMMAGALDGDWLRVEKYAEMFGQNLVAVPVPLFEIEAILLFVDKSIFKGQSIDLKGRRVGFQAGYNWLEKTLSDEGAIPVPLPPSALVKPLLIRGRIDILATNGVRAKMISDTFNENDPPLNLYNWRKINIYHFIHPRHADKLDALTHAFEAAIANGAFEEIYAMPGINRANGN